MAVWKQLRNMLENILAAARDLRQEYGRRGEGGVWKEVEEYE